MQQVFLFGFFFKLEVLDFEIFVECHQKWGRVIGPWLQLQEPIFDSSCKWKLGYNTSL